MTVSLSILQRKFKVVEARWVQAKGKMEEEGWSSRLKYLSMEQFVIARRRPRYVKPISENLDAFSPAGSWSFLVEEAAHAAEGRRKWRSGDACRALTDWRAAGKLEWNWKKIGRWYRFRFRPFHVFRIFSIFLSQKKKKREKRLIDWLIDNLKFRGEKDHCTDYYYRKGCRIERKIIYLHCLHCFYINIFLNFSLRIASFF